MDGQPARRRARHSRITPAQALQQLTAGVRDIAGAQRQDDIAVAGRGRQCVGERRALTRP